MPYRLCLAILTALLWRHPLGFSQEWTRFRGPDGSGIGQGEEIPVSLSESVALWTAELPGPGHSSPVLWGGKLLVTCARVEQSEREVVCLDATDGRQLWSWKTPFVSYRHHAHNSFAASTPALDSERVYISWITGGRFIVLALSHEGELVWREDLGPFKALHGSGNSPIVLDGVVIAGNDNASGDSFVVGLDAATGRTVWKQARQSTTMSYITPPVRRLDAGAVEAVFVSPPHGISGLDPKTGEVKWEVKVPFTQKSVASPVIAGRLVVATAGRGGIGKESAVVTAGAGAKRLYELRVECAYVPTPIFVDGLLYVLSDRGSISCIEPESGAVVWQERIAGTYYSSPVCADGRIWLINRQGAVTVLAAGRQFEVLARSQLPEGTHATPAIANGRMYVRTLRHVLCFGAR